MKNVKETNATTFDVQSGETYGSSTAASSRETEELRRDGKSAMPKILVVDDDPDMVAICSLVLESEGYEVDAARNGSEALGKLADDSIDVVLLDVMMPVLDGLTLCKMVKKDPRTKDLPVVLISASTALRERGRHCADAVLEKPFDIDYLVDTVNHFAPLG